MITIKVNNTILEFEEANLDTTINYNMTHRTSYCILKSRCGTTNFYAVEFTKGFYMGIISPFSTAIIGIYNSFYKPSDQISSNFEACKAHTIEFLNKFNTLQVFI